MRRGFTLIELLVVISIIAILASMLMVAIKLVREGAISLKCRASLRQIGLAALGYSNDNDGYLADCKGNGADWATRISPYAEADNKGQDSGWGNFVSKGRVFGGCMKAKATGGPNVGYAMSYLLYGPGAPSAGYSFTANASDPVKSFRLDQITIPSSRFFIGERHGDQNIGGVGNVDFTRHNQRTNVVFCDFHVGSHARAEVALAITDPAKF